MKKPKNIKKFFYNEQEQKNKIFENFRKNSKKLYMYIFFFKPLYLNNFFFKILQLQFVKTSTIFNRFLCSLQQIFQKDYAYNLYWRNFEFPFEKKSKKIKEIKIL